MTDLEQLTKQNELNGLGLLRLPTQLTNRLSEVQRKINTGIIRPLTDSKVQEVINSKSDAINSNSLPANFNPVNAGQQPVIMTMSPTKSSSNSVNTMQTIQIDPVPSIPTPVIINPQTTNNNSQVAVGVFAKSQEWLVANKKGVGIGLLVAGAILAGVVVAKSSDKDKKKPKAPNAKADDTKSLGATPPKKRKPASKAKGKQKQGSSAKSSRKNSTKTIKV